MTAIVSGFYDCVGSCMDHVPPSGLGEVAAALVFTVVALAPGVALHRFLRRRGR